MKPRSVPHFHVESPMPFTGTIQSWQDDRGFGFIQPTQGGQEIFVHIKSFTSRGGSRPQVGQRVTFEVELNAQGKKRAKNVALVRAATASAVQRQRRAAESPAQWGTASLFALPAFLLVYLAVAVFWRVPGWVAALYAGASVVCALAYAIDKSAAVAGRWRVSESTLHTLSLVGGWPGALVAQQVLRHKSNKAAFRSVFWATVVANVAGFVAFHSPLAAGWRV
jgi:uncharacterized membrane protein YsdA (DUF1294 family)/cold shock CspA family protein